MTCSHASSWLSVTSFASPPMRRTNFGLPSRIIRTTAELALRHERTPQDYRTALADVLGQARHMSELVDDLLVLARTDAGIERRETAPLDLRTIVSDATREIGEFANRSSVSVLVDLPSEPLMLKGDAVTLRRLLLILLDNAVKYSPSGGTVSLHLGSPRADPGRTSAVVQISDSGIGFDSAESATTL